MATPENPKVGGCYVWFISFLLFVFTLSGAFFLVLYITQPTSTATTFYPIIGVSLVCMPWFFWLLTLLYRIISRSYGFRLICFGPFGSGYPDDDDGNLPAASTNPAADYAGAGAAVAQPASSPAALIPNSAVGAVGVGRGSGSGDPNLGDIQVNVNGNGNGNGNGGDINRDSGTPRRVHFGGVMVIGEDVVTNIIENQGTPKALSRSSSSSSSSSSSRHSDESEMPLRLAMA